MPLYDFECGICKHKFEEIVKSYTVKVVSCIKCGGPSDRTEVNKNVTHQFKCKGFHITDYKKENKKALPTKARLKNE